MFCHGFTGNRIETRRMFARAGAMLAERGIAAFRFDHRGCGESSGNFLDFTPGAILEDLDCAVSQILNQPEFVLSKIALCGYSLGGASASYVANGNPLFRTAVLWAPVAVPGIVRERLAQTAGFESYKERGFYDYGGFRVNSQYLDQVSEHLKPLEWITTFGGPILICHGEQDPIVPPSHARLYLEARKNPLDELLLLSGGDHSFSNADNIDKVLDRTVRWFTDLLS
jgi:pimeloyl-ACP methyl ester carboxylesterase